MHILRKVPFLAFLVAAYGIAMLFGEPQDVLATHILTARILSGAQFILTFGDLLVALAIVALYIEILKATRTSASAIVDHILSTLVLLVCVISFLFLPKAGTSTFLLLTIMALLDVIAGFIVSSSPTRRGLAVRDRDILP